MEMSVKKVEAKFMQRRGRSFQVAILKDGNLMAMGGKEEWAGESLGSTETFDRSNNSWSLGASMNCPRYGFAHAVVDDVVYVFGGLINQQAMCNDPHDYSFGPMIGYNLETEMVSCSEYYDQNSNEWKVLRCQSSFQFKPRQGHAATAIGTEIYLVGGYADGKKLSMCEKFDTVSGRVEVLPSMLRKRHHCSAVAVNDKLFVFGGSDEDPFSAEMYNPIKGKWSMLTPMHHKSGFICFAATVGTDIIVTGGDGRALDVYSTKTNSWKGIPGMKELGSSCCYMTSVGKEIIFIHSSGEIQSCLASISSKKIGLTEPTSAGTKSKLLYVDAANFTGRFFKYKRPWNLEQAQKEVCKMCNAATKSGWTMVVYLDQATMTVEAIKKWRSRREKEVRKGERMVPQGALRLVGDMFTRCGIEVHYSVEADNDDTIASHAHHDGADVLSGDRDFFRYTNFQYALYKDFKIGKGKFFLIKHDGKRNSTQRDIIPNPPLTGTCNPFRDCIQEKNYLRGSPSPLVELNNVHILVRPLRAALYAHLGLDHVEEEFPVLKDNTCAWDKTLVQADETCSELLLSPCDAVKRFDCERPRDVPNKNWYKHQFALRCIVAEICCTVTGSTLLETLEPLLDDMPKSHYILWREEQKTGETNKQKRERYLKLYPPEDREARQEAK